ncbi:MAG TPA: hypothetical protein PLR37_08710 [Candidatus Accumulibacter phosphatis]|nr:hypothetical protein [Candidatus Accumulibacter phosphatis]
MGHIQHLARKRRTATFFGTECQLADLSHSAIERQRCEDENAMLRAEVVDLKLALSASIQGQHATALKLAELMERESALVAAIEQDGRRLRIAEDKIDVLHVEIDALIEASRTIEQLSETDSE